MEEDTQRLRDKEAKPNKLLSFFSNPWLCMVTTLCTISGFILGIYTLIITTSIRELIYTISPVKAQILKSGQLSDMHVYYNNTEIKSDITVVQIAIWNEGKESIKPENILKGIKIITSPNIPIIEAQVKKQSRDVINAKLDKQYFAQGFIPISWDILEKNDGMIVQLTYSGPEEVNINLEGVIEGQQNIIFQKPTLKIKTPREQQVNLAWTVLLIFSIGMVLATLRFVLIRLHKLPAKKYASIITNSASVILFILLIIMIYFNSTTKYYTPPFGF